jgi:hypothetical protein
MRATLPHSAFTDGPAMQLATNTALVHTHDAARRDVPAQVPLRSLQVGLHRHELPGVPVRHPERRVLSPPIGNRRQSAPSELMITTLMCHR